MDCFWRSHTSSATFSIIEPSGSDEFYRSLLRFEITGVDDPGDIVNAYLELTGWKHNGDPVFFHSTQEFHEVLTPWGEGAGVESVPPANGEVSWTYSEFPISWSIPGVSDAGIDHGADPVMRGRLTSELRAKFYLSSEAFVELVRQWVEQPQTNHGLVFRPDDESSKQIMNIGSREVTDPFYRPRLVIETRLSTCSTDADCDDGNACMTNNCDLQSASCNNTPVIAGTSCDDSFGFFGDARSR